jgi:putative ABC transport system substrate-binding protein
MPPLLRATRTVPIVFGNVADPVGSGFVESLSRPGGNATGFMQFEYSLSGKWLDVLQQLVPSVRRAAILRDAEQIAESASSQTMAPSLGIEAIPINVRDAPEIERTVAAFARGPNGGLIVTAGILSVFHRGLIIKLAAERKLPAVYYRRFYYRRRPMHRHHAAHHCLGHEQARRRHLVARRLHLRSAA